MLNTIKGNFKKISSAILKMVILPIVILTIIDKSSISSLRDFITNFSIEKFDLCFFRYLAFSKATLIDIPMILSFAIVILNIFCSASMLMLLCFLFILTISFILKDLRVNQIKYENKNINGDKSSLYLLTSRFLC